MNYRLIITLSIALLALAGSSLGGSGIALNVQLPHNPYAPSRLGEKLDIFMSAINNVDIDRNGIIIFKPEDRARALDFDYLIDLGIEQNRKFIVDVNFDKVVIETRKSSILPVLISRYRVYAVMYGHIRIVDVENRRLVKLKPVQYEVKTKDRWQFTDDNQNDADLLIPPDKKVELFEELDRVVAKELYQELKALSTN